MLLQPPFAVAARPFGQRDQVCPSLPDRTCQDRSIAFIAQHARAMRRKLVTHPTVASGNHGLAGGESLHEHAGRACGVDGSPVGQQHDVGLVQLPVICLRAEHLHQQLAVRQALCAEGGDCAGDFRRGIVTLQDELEALAETIAVQNADGIEYLVDTLLIAGAAKADEPAPLCRIGRPRRAVAHFRRYVRDRQHLDRQCGKFLEQVPKSLTVSCETHAASLCDAFQEMERADCHRRTIEIRLIAQQINEREGPFPAQQQRQ